MSIGQQNDVESFHISILHHQISIYAIHGQGPLTVPRSTSVQCVKDVGFTKIAFSCSGCGLNNDSHNT